MLDELQQKYESVFPRLDEPNFQGTGPVPTRSI